MDYGEFYFYDKTVGNAVETFANGQSYSDNSKLEINEADLAKVNLKTFATIYAFFFFFWKKKFLRV